MMTPIETLIPLYWKAKEAAAQAASNLSDVQAAIVSMLPKKDEGTVTQEIDETKVTVTYSVNRTVNTSALQALWGDLPASAQACFAWKASVAVKEMRSAQQMDAAAYAAAAQFITSTPAKPALKIEKK